MHTATHGPVVVVRGERCTLLTFLLAQKQNTVPGKCCEAFQPYNLLFLYLFLYNIRDTTMRVQMYNVFNVVNKNICYGLIILYYYQS